MPPPEQQLNLDSSHEPQNIGASITQPSTPPPTTTPNQVQHYSHLLSGALYPYPTFPFSPFQPYPYFYQQPPPSTPAPAQESYRSLYPAQPLAPPQPPPPPPPPTAPPPPPKPKLAFVNGRFLDIRQASISVLDLGFCFGASVAEEIAVHHGQLVQLDQHLASLSASALVLGVKLPIPPQTLIQVARHLVKVNKDGPRALVIIQLSLGTYGRRTRRIPPRGESEMPTLVVYTESLGEVDRRMYMKGLGLMGGDEDKRDKRLEQGIASAIVNRVVVSSGIVPGSMSALGDVLALRIANERGFDDALLFDGRSGDVISTTLGALFVVKFGVIYTPPVLGDVKASVMRSFVLEVVKQARLAVREIPVTPPFLRSATEVFVANIADEVCPVSRIGNTEMKETPGPVTRKVMGLVIAAIEKEIGLPHEKRDLFEALLKNHNSP